MDFVQTGSRFASSLCNPITTRASTGKAKSTHHGIARPVALKSAVSPPDTMCGFNEKDSQLERTPITNDGHSPKKLCAWPTSPAGAGLGHTLPGFESSKTWADYCRHFSQERNYHLAGNLTKPDGQESMSRTSHGSEIDGKKDTAASPLEGKLRQHAPSVVALDTGNGGGTGESKRSAFREVARRQGTGLYDQRTTPSTSSSSSSPSTSLLRQRGGEVHDHPQEIPSDKTLPYSLNSAISVHTPLLPNQLFYSSSSQPLSVSAMGGSIPHNSTELRERFRAPSLIPVKQQLHADFVKYTPDKHHRNPYSPGAKVSQINTSPIRDTSALHFGAFQNNAPTGKMMNSLPVPWQQQPVFPAGVLPLSSSVATPQYDNWCAKCNASFRMTSDLVYHMRTQHKRSAEGNSATNDKPGTKRSAEEKLKCDFCGETFRERHHLTRHMTSHNNNE
ncbi:uncharacterized protein [Asterias amurensis]|uniref:uncharacterized protein n=1 Tax=Asterias amurensis TaxID=7602 RepID=UPI003AB12E77